MEMVIENEYLKTMSLFRISDKKEQLDKMEKLATIIQDRVLRKKVLDYTNGTRKLPDETHLKMIKDQEKSKNLLEALQAKRELQCYLEAVINSKKPYWQILAEQNGWKKGE